MLQPKLDDFRHILLHLLLLVFTLRPLTRREQELLANFKDNGEKIISVRISITVIKDHDQNQLAGKRI